MYESVLQILILLSVYDARVVRKSSFVSSAALEESTAILRRKESPGDGGEAGGLIKALPLAIHGRHTGLTYEYSLESRS